MTNVTNVYNKTVIVNNTSTTSFNGGNGGVQARPTAQEEAYGREQHTTALAAQSEHEHAASQNRDNFASVNHGRPAIAATARPGDFSRHSAVPARAAGGEYHAPAMSPKEARVASNGNNRGRSNDGFRPFTPPSKSATAPAHGGNASSYQRGGNATGNSPYRPAESRPSENGRYDSRPQNQPHEAAHQNPPRENVGRPNPQPRQGPPPKEEHHR